MSIETAEDEILSFQDLLESFQRSKQKNIHVFCKKETEWKVRKLI